MLKAGCFPFPKKRVSRSVCISLISYNRLEMTKRCLDLLYEATEQFDLIITDNASTDGSQEFLAEFVKGVPNARLVQNTENLGYKDPHNNAFFSCISDPMRKRPEFFVALNNDMEMGPGWWPMVEDAFAADPSVAIVGNSAHVCSRLKENFEGMPAMPGQEPEYVEGSLLVIRTDIAEKFGMFAPELKFIYGEDSDLSLRVREAGYRIALLRLPCKHLVSQTVRKLDKFTTAKLNDCLRENHLWLRKRWAVYLRKRNFNYQVVVKRAYAIGDVLYTTPVVKALKQKWPLADIHVQTDCPGVFLNNPYVKAAQKDFQQTFDYAYDLNLGYERRPLVHPVTAYADLCEVKLDLGKAKVDIFPTERDAVMAGHLFHRTVEDRWACIHPGPTNWPGRDWPQPRWDALIKQLLKSGWRVAIIGSGAWKFSQPGVLDLQNRTSLQVLFYLLQCFDMFIGLDSGPSHVAQAAGCPSVVLFGTILPELRLMHQSLVIPVQADIRKVPCVGEHHRLPPPVTYSSCAGKCMDAITVAMVSAAINRVIDEAHL